MGWKEDILDTKLGVKVIDTRIMDVAKRQVATDMKLDMLHKLMQDQLSKMADRVLEAAMIQQGGLQDAVKHRNVSRMDGPTPSSEPDELWDDDETWPPKGSLEIKTP